MTTVSSSPFSARNRRERNLIENDFPVSARTGLLHILAEAVDLDYVSGWTIVARELGRIARIAPRYYNDTSVKSINDARLDVETNLNQLHWEKAYDFCERLYSHLAQGDIIRWRNDVEVTITKAQSQLFFAEEIQRLFEEEGLGFEFRDGSVQRRGKLHTTNQISRAERSLADNRLDAARIHFSKALRYFHDRKKPDHENAVKEAVCAVEAAAKKLFPDAKAKTLGEFINWMTSGEHNLLPKTIGQTFIGLYGFRNSGEGVSHGAASGGVVTAELSEYVLGMAASQILLLDDLAKNDVEPPF